MNTYALKATVTLNKECSLLPAAAELEYLNVARYLDHYGVKSHVVKTMSAMKVGRIPEVKTNFILFETVSLPKK
ncbi:unnamed protein product [Trichobilharzia regenti]|nr:unnamed protein product [Trichobilharzia regenti]